MSTVKKMVICRWCFRNISNKNLLFGNQSLKKIWTSYSEKSKYSKNLKKINTKSITNKIVILILSPSIWIIIVERKLISIIKNINSFLYGLRESLFSAYLIIQYFNLFVFSSNKNRKNISFKHSWMEKMQKRKINVFKYFQIKILTQDTDIRWELVEVVLEK